MSALREILQLATRRHSFFAAPADVSEAELKHAENALPEAIADVNVRLRALMKMNESLASHFAHVALVDAEQLRAISAIEFSEAAESISHQRLQDVLNQVARSALLACQQVQSVAELAPLEDDDDAVLAELRRALRSAGEIDDDESLVKDTGARSTRGK